jgi:DNA-binding response OmpR family regulator
MHPVMLVDDDASMLSLLELLLEMEGFQVVKPPGDHNLATMLDSLRQAKPELVLLDVHLYNTNGFDFLRLIRKDSELSDTLVLMSSGMELSLECRQEGADGFILKPYMPDELVAKIRHTIGVKG